MGEPSAVLRSNPRPPSKRLWRYTRWGSVFLSPDFYIALPVGIAIGALPAFSHAVADSATTALYAFGGALVAMAATVVTAKAIFVTLLTPEYVPVLERAKGGIAGSTRPFIVTAWVSAFGAIVSFTSALAWPAIPAKHWQWLIWLAFSVPSFLFSWGVIGSAQVVSIGAFHVRQRAALGKAILEVRRRNRRSA
jgi:hypothetical protein